MAHILGTLRLALRTLVRKPVFAIVAVLTLAFGIGANVAIFTLAESLLLRPLPYADPSRLMMVWEAGPGDFGNEVGASILDYSDWRREAKQISMLAAYGKQGFNLAGGDDAEYVDGQVVSANFFDTLGVKLALGRPFRLEDEDAGAARAVVLSDGLWRRRYGSDAAIVGKSVLLSGESYTVAGVTPRGWRAPERAELWVPLSFYTGNTRIWRSTHQLTVFGRLAPGATTVSAEAELRGIARPIWDNEATAWQPEWTVRLESLVDQLLGDYRKTVVALWIAVALVLLITCANLANLLLVRGISRARELAVRAALGASAMRLIGELVAEAMVIAAAAAAMGIGGAMAVVRAVHRLLPQSLVHLLESGVSGAALAYGLTIAVGSALLFSILPAWRVARTDATSLMATARTAGGRHRIGYLFVVVQVALSVPLLVGCLLMVRTMRNYAGVDAGLRAESVVTFRIVPSPALYQQPTSRVALYRRIEERLAAMPGVERAGMSSNIPFSRVGTQTATSVFVEGRPPEERGAGDVRAVSPGLLRALGIRMIRGRWIEDGDMTGPRVAVINEAMARALWPNADPLGSRIIDGGETLLTDSPDRWFTIVGIAADARSGGLRRDPVPEVYLPYAKRPTRGMMFVMRGAEASALISVARAAVREADARQPIFEVAKMTDLVGESIAAPRLAFYLFGVLGVVALLLVTVGTYGVVAYSVGLRRQELGLRASLGATPGVLWRMVLFDGLRVAMAGLVAGLIMARTGSRVLESVLYGVGGGDVLATSVAVATVFAAVLGATYIPALSAMRVSPAEALRQE